MRSAIRNPAGTWERSQSRYEGAREESRPRFAIRQVLRTQSGEKLLDLRKRFLVIDVLNVRSVAGRIRTSFSRKIDRFMIVRDIDQVRAARIRPVSGRSPHIQRAYDDERRGGKLQINREKTRSDGQTKSDRNRDRDD
jgi:hypothetical protein